MKKISISIEPKLWAKWDRWKDSEELRRAFGFPCEFIRNLKGGKDKIDDQFKDFLRDYLRPDGPKRELLLAVFRRSRRMTVHLSEWMGQIFVGIALFEPRREESLFELTVIFAEHRSASYQWMKPPIND